MKPQVDVSEAAGHASRYSGLEAAIERAAASQETTLIVRDGKVIAKVAPVSLRSILVSHDPRTGQNQTELDYG